MPSASDKIMFEIFREAGYDRQFRVVFFTELDEHNKEREINRALTGEHLFDGFIAELHKDEGKRRIDTLLRRLNAGEPIGPAEIEAALGEVLV